jgi:hypothetical protein
MSDSQFHEDYMTWDNLIFMKKYADDFVRQIDDQQKNYSKPDYIDMLTELKELVEIKIEVLKQEQQENEQ